ncbi:MAG: hypothetical protein ABIP97_12765 [Chthoniobacterales bacterium]
MHPALIHFIPRFRVSVLAVLGGIVADNGLSYLFTIIYDIFLSSTLALPDSTPEAFTKYINTSHLLLLSYLMVGFLGTFCGAYLTATLAREDKIANATLVGVAALLLGLFFWGGNPTWVDILGLILIVPIAAFAGFCARWIGGTPEAPASADNPE